LRTIRELMALALEREASDLHLVAGTPPCLRIHGAIHFLEDGLLQGEQIRSMVQEILSPAQLERLDFELELEFSYTEPSLGRFRAALFFERANLAAAFRVVPLKVRSVHDLKLPTAVHDLARRQAGLVLIAGATGQGKTTTMNAMIDLINSEKRARIITIEDPIEFVHKHKGCLVNQREIGADTKSFVNALKYILRQDPDVVFIGEMRDLETMQAALTISETGHLVFATLHTNSAVQTVNRIVDAFPAHQQSQIRAQLAFVLEAVIAQQLIPRLDGKGRVMSSEVMISTPAIRNLIREDKIHQIYSQMQVGQTKHGMQTMNQSLLNLYMRKFVSLDDALGRSMDPEELRQMMSSPSQQRNVSGTERR